MNIILKMQLNVLIHLAMVDGQISGEEKRCLENIAGNHGITTDELDRMIKHPKPIESLGALSDNQKFEYLYSIVYLMNVDEEVDKREIHFCQNMALRLGYYKEVINELWGEIMKDKNLKENKEELKRKVQGYNPYI